MFADEAQAIYGFADDREVRPGEFAEPSFPEKIRGGAAGPFRRSELTDVHRTGSPRLLTIFSDTRRKVLAPAGDRTDKLADIKDEIISLAHGEAPKIDDSALAELEDAFILYRRRCDVLLTSSMLTQNGITHRVRMSGLPVCLAPWIGAALAEYTEHSLNNGTFEQLWLNNVHGTPLATCDVDLPGPAWSGWQAAPRQSWTLVCYGSDLGAGSLQPNSVIPNWAFAARLWARFMRQRVGRRTRCTSCCPTATTRMLIRKKNPGLYLSVRHADVPSC